MSQKVRDAIMLAVTPVIQDHKRDQECAEAVIGGLLSAGYVIVPRKPTEDMIDAGCDSDAYTIAVHENKKRHEDLMAKYPGALKPRETHGAAPIQTLPIIWGAMVDAFLSADTE